LAEAAAGKIWSTRFEEVKPHPGSVAAEVIVVPARAEDLPTIERLLEEVGLPTDVTPSLSDFLVARHQYNIVGCVQGPDALFRSLAVDPAYRGSGLGRRLYKTLVETVRGKFVERAYLLTTTIASLGESWGFKRIDRAEVPAGIQATSQFRGACCASAVAMWREV